MSWGLDIVKYISGDCRHTAYLFDANTLLLSKPLATLRPQRQDRIVEVTYVPPHQLEVLP